MTTPQDERALLIARAMKQSTEIGQIFLDAFHWNNTHPNDEPINPDPDGQLRRIAYGLHKTLKAEGILPQSVGFNGLTEVETSETASVMGFSRPAVAQPAAVGAVPHDFPPYIMGLLREVADRSPGPYKGPWEDQDGMPRQDDADAAIAWIEARAVGAVPEWREWVDVIREKLSRFMECAEDSDSGGVDIGRDWLDALTTIGLLRRVQRSPALWEITAAGEAVLSASPQPKEPTA